jgi:hypothetical protein
MFSKSVFSSFLFFSAMTMAEIKGSVGLMSGYIRKSMTAMRFA